MLETRTLTAALNTPQLMKTFIIALVVQMSIFPHDIYTHTNTFEQKMTHDKSS